MRDEAAYIPALFRNRERSSVGFLVRPDIYPRTSAI
jgi:hypothetical protein